MKKMNKIMKPSFLRFFLKLSVSGFIFSLTGCDLSPPYKPPHFIYPNGWEGKGVMGNAKPADNFAGGAWWRVFHDPLLDGYEERLLKNNPDIQAATEIFTQERDIARETESQLYPQFSGSGGMSKNKASNGRLFYSGGREIEYESNEYYSGAASWEPDFWNSIRNSTHMEKNLAQASAAQYALTRLTLEAELASDYIALRGIDAQIAVYSDSIKYFETAVEITRLRQGGDIGAGLDVSRAESQLYDAMAGRDNLTAQRQVLEHAIAVLLNIVPASFHIEAIKDVHLHFESLKIDAGLPSYLLERRPDIAVAERKMAASVRAIGVSRAAFYPHITFSATGGFQDGGFDLASISNSFWTIAVQSVEPFFTGGLRRAALQRSWAQYRENVDEYRSVVLGAFQDVEDSLSQTRYFEEARRYQHQAVGAALRTQNMTMALYTGGLSNYLDALVAQEQALKVRLLEVQAQTAQIQADVRLIRALGGGWNRSKLPNIQEIDPFNPLQYEGLHYAQPAGEVPSVTGGKMKGSVVPVEGRDLTGKE